MYFQMENPLTSENSIRHRDRIGTAHAAGKIEETDNEKWRMWLISKLQIEKRKKVGAG